MNNPKTYEQIKAKSGGIIMTEKQQALSNALDAMETATMKHWPAVVEATNALAQAIKEGKEDYSHGTYTRPPELERKFDVGALNTAWIYDRLEAARGRGRRTPTRVKIRQALGYHTH